MLKSAFDIEKKRQELARDGKLDDLKKTYSRTFPEIKDLNTPKFWDEIHKEDISLDGQDGMTRDRINTAVKFIPNGKIKLLDIGAGVGFVEELINKNRNISIHANDFSKTSVNILKRKFRGNFSIQSIYNLKYPKNYFNVILVLEVLEHIPPSRLFKILESISKLLKKDGVLIVSVPMNEGLENMTSNPSGHVRMYTQDLIKAELIIAGFKTVKQETFFAFPSLYFLKTLMAKLTKRKHPNNIIVKAIKL